MRPQTKPHKKTNETLSYPSSPMYEVVSQTRETVFHRDIQAPRREETTTRSRVLLLTKFEKFGEQVKHCLESVDIFFFFNRNKN